MKHLNKLVAVVAVLSFAGSAMADPSAGGTFYWRDTATNTTYTFTAEGTVTLSLYPGASSGGAFNAATSWILPNPGTDFSTYCIESTVTFSPGTTYTASIDPSAFRGNALSGDAVSDVTENIYGNWLRADLTGAQNLGFSSVAAMQSSAGQLAISRAIWWAEGETGGSQNAVANSMLSALGYSLGTTPSQLLAATHVEAMNMWRFGSSQDTQYGLTGWWATDVQSQLIVTSPFTPVPVPGAALLGMMGFGMIGWIKKRRLQQ